MPFNSELLNTLYLWLLPAAYVILLLVAWPWKKQASVRAVWTVIFIVGAAMLVYHCFASYESLLRDNRVFQCLTAIICLFVFVLSLSLKGTDKIVLWAWIAVCLFGILVQNHSINRMLHQYHVGAYYEYFFLSYAYSSVCIRLLPAFACAAASFFAGPKWRKVCIIQWIITAALIVQYLVFWKKLETAEPLGTASVLLIANSILGFGIALASLIVSKPKTAANGRLPAFVGIVFSIAAQCMFFLEKLKEVGPSPVESSWFLHEYFSEGLLFVTPLMAIALLLFFMALFQRQNTMAVAAEPAIGELDAKKEGTVE